MQLLHQVRNHSMPQDPNHMQLHSQHIMHHGQYFATIKETCNQITSPINLEISNTYNTP